MISNLSFPRKRESIYRLFDTSLDSRFRGNDVVFVLLLILGMMLVGNASATCLTRGTGDMGLVIERTTMRPLIGQPLFASFLVTFAVFMLTLGTLHVVLLRVRAML